VYYYNTRDRILVKIEPRVTFNADEGEDDILEFFRKELDKRVKKIGYRVEDLIERELETVVMLRKL